MTMAAQAFQEAHYAPKELEYAYQALSPYISEETLRFHHDKHYVGYVNKLNELVVGTPYEGKSFEEMILEADGAVYNNAAQAWNHEFYFEQFSAAPQHEPQGDLLDAISRSFGSYDAMKTRVAAEAASLFGSGWVWLAADTRGGLSVVATPNAGNPLREGLTPLFCVDVWEHAYYLDYQNRRADAVSAFWEILDWAKVGERLTK